MYIDGGSLRFATLRRQLPLWWHRLPVGVHSPIWPGILAALIILGMLTVFHQVVHEAVQQSELRHKATALQAEATQRCNSLQGPHASGSCLLQLNATTHGNALLQARNIALAAPI